MTYKQVVDINIIVFLITSIACNKDDNLMAQSLSCSYRFTTESENIIVQDFPPACPTEAQEGEETYYRYHSPVFNPQNPNQIAYVRRNMFTSNQNAGVLKLYVFDLCLGEANLVREDSLLSYGIDWGRDDWIVYRKWYENIYKVRPDGTQDSEFIDTPFAFSLPNHLNIWNGKGDKMAWINGELRYHYPAHILVCGFVISDESGIVVDTINQFCRRVAPPAPNYQPYQEGNLELFEVDNWSWSPDDKKIACSARSLVDYTYVYGLFYYDFDLDGIVFVDDLLITSWYGPVTSTAWMPDSRKLVWSTERSIVQKDIDTGERKIILTSPGNHWYKNIDISPDGKTIIIERVNRVVVDGCTKTEHALYLVNSDGTDERRIIIPE